MTRSSSDSEKQRLYVTLKEVAGDVFGNDFSVGFERVEVGVTEFGGDFETDVRKLAEVRVMETYTSPTLLQSLRPA